MPKTINQIERAQKFYENMESLLHEAEALRDLTTDPDDKRVFNQTRGALLPIVMEAKKMYYRWADL